MYTMSRGLPFFVLLPTTALRHRRKRAGQVVVLVPLFFVCHSHALS